MTAIRTIVIAVGAAACADSSALHGGNDDNPGAGAPVGCLASSECPAGSTCNEFHVCVAMSPPGDGGAPAETEIALGPPTSSQRFVYVAMTAQGKLARIDGDTLSVVTTPVGPSPREVATIPGSDGAIALDAIGGTATVVRPVNGSGDGTRVLATLPSLNRVDVEPNGQFAVIWFDPVRAQGDGTGSSGSFQDVVVAALAPGHESSVALTVGFRPRAVQFDAAGARAYVITEDGVSVVDLGDAIQRGPRLVPPIAVAEPGVAAGDLEVQVVATGDYAAVRQAGHAGVRVISLRGATIGQAFDIPLAAAPTDIDLAPDGSRLYAAVRDAGELAVIDIPADALDPSGVEHVDLGGALAGSLAVSADGKRALLYTNATLDPHVTLVALDQPGFPRATYPLHKAVRAVAIAPDGATAVVVSAKAPGDPAAAGSLDEVIARSFGFELVDLATGFAKLQLTPVDPGAPAFAPDGSTAYLALDGGDAATATRAVQVLSTRTGIVRSHLLGSPPSSLGVVPIAGQAFIAQRHPLGRMSFVALATGAVRTLTGFDLNSQIVDH